MCNCKTNIEAELNERFKAAEPMASGHKVELQGYGMSIDGNTMTLRPYMLCIGAADYPKKGGGTRHKETKQTLAFNFCPFCGVKIGGAT